MTVLNGLSQKGVFKYFEEISAVPRSSGNTEGIAGYCLNFAAEHGLRALKDDADNVVIFKPASAGYENADPVILQGHLDMVCQKTPDSDIDFLKKGPELFIDGDLIGAKNTTLGADNGIAVAMILSILADKNINHPPIEAVFTSDEEIGMIGASAFDASVLKGTRMINLDSEELETVTVSCAGGSDFRAFIPVTRQKAVGTRIKVTLSGLKGGHSGICINEGRQNADMLAGRFLDFAAKHTRFSIISVKGGDKGNAIPSCCEMELCCEDASDFVEKTKEYAEVIKKELSGREPDFCYCAEVLEEGEFDCADSKSQERIIYALLCAPGGVVEMSAEIEGLVETSLNLGILEMRETECLLSFALRSNRNSALKFLEEKLMTFFKLLNAKTEASGYYPPWEFNQNSEMRQIYVRTFTEQLGHEPKVEAIHAGLECGVFAGKISGFDGISIGPQLYDVHTVNERLSISSVEKIYNLVLSVLEKCY